MKKLAILGLIVAALAAPVPSSSEPTGDGGCTASTGVTASALLGDSAPRCDFTVNCQSNCIWSVDLTVNGTGQVAGTMTAEQILGLGSSGFFTISSNAANAPAPDPSCGPELLRCHDGSQLNQLPSGGFTYGPVLIVAPSSEGVGATIRITCTGGGLAVVQTVGCSLSSLF